MVTSSICLVSFLMTGAYSQMEKEKERCSGSFHLAVRFLVIKDDSISERPG